MKTGSHRVTIRDNYLIVHYNDYRRFIYNKRRVL